MAVRPKPLSEQHGDGPTNGAARSDKHGHVRERSFHAAALRGRFARRAAGARDRPAAGEAPGSPSYV